MDIFLNQQIQFNSRQIIIFITYFTQYDVLPHNIDRHTTTAYTWGEVTSP